MTPVRLLPLLLLLAAGYPCLFVALSAAEHVQWVRREDRRHAAWHAATQPAYDAEIADLQAQRAGR